MYTSSPTRYRSTQKLHPLSLLAQSVSRQVSGCLRISNQFASWSIYLDQGKLVYASYSINPFERLDRHLRRLSAQVPALVSAIRVQIRLLFEKNLDTPSSLSADYQAICWLVSQQYLTVDQAATLIEDLAKEVLEPFLSLKEGTVEIIPLNESELSPTFCQLDLRAIVESCQIQSRSSPSATSSSLGAVTQTPVMNGDRTPLNSDHVTRLPLTAKDSASTPPGETAIASQHKGIYTIACIDDSPTVLNAIKSFLDDKSFSVLMISNPVQALMQIMRSKPDLILLDVEMPNLDGYELCSLLRRHSSFKNTPIIIVTGNTGFIDRAKAKLVRASGYLTKPFTQSDLLKMVFKHLN